MKKTGTFNTRLVRLRNEFGQRVIQYKTVTYSANGVPISCGDPLVFDESEIPNLAMEVGAAAVRPVLRYPEDFADFDDSADEYEYAP